MKKYLVSIIFSYLLCTSAFAISGCYGLMGEWKGQIKLTTGEVVPLDVSIYSLGLAGGGSSQPGVVKYYLVGDINDHYIVENGGCSQYYTAIDDIFINNKIAQIDSKSFKLGDGFAITAIQNITGTYDNKTIDITHPENNYLIKTSSRK